MQEAETLHKEYVEKLDNSKEKIEKNTAQEKSELSVKMQLKDKLQRLNDEVIFFYTISGQMLIFKYCIYSRTSR